MAKTKAHVKAASTPEKALSTIKDGRVTKAIQSAKSKTKEVAKAAVAKHGSKKPTAKDVSSEEEDSEDDGSSVDSGDGDSDDSDGSDSSDDSIGSAQKHVKSANGANGVNGIKATEDSDESDSTDSGSDEEDIVAAKAVPPTNGAKKSVKSGANASEEDDSFHSADEKPEAKFQPDSDADSDSDVDDDSSSDGSDSDGEEQPKAIVAAPVKINGTANVDNVSEPVHIFNHVFNNNRNPRKILVTLTTLMTMKKSSQCPRSARLKKKRPS
jgi:nucleolin